MGTGAFSKKILPPASADSSHPPFWNHCQEGLAHKNDELDLSTVRLASFFVKVVRQTWVSSTLCLLSESSNMSGALESYVNRPVSVITADGRNFVGTLKVS